MTAVRNFLKEFKGAFHYLYYPYNTSMSLMNLIQGQQTVSDYTIEFQTLAIDVNWSGVELSEQIKDELVTIDDPANLNSLISLCNSIDNCLRFHKREKTSTPTSRPRPLQFQPSSSFPCPTTHFISRGTNAPGLSMVVSQRKVEVVAG